MLRFAEHLLRKWWAQATGRQEEENNTTSVCDKSDRATDSITCLFCPELHLTVLCSGARNLFGPEGKF